MKIIDMHTHIGSWKPKNKYFEVQNLLSSFQNVNVEAFCVSNLDIIDCCGADNMPVLDEIKGNEKLLDVFQDNPKARLLLVYESQYGNAFNIEFLLEKYPDKFCGLKLHPECHKTPANSPLYDPYLTVAEKYNLPCLFHSGDVKSPYSSPKLIYELAKRHPSVSVVLGHLSTGGMSAKKTALKIINASINTNNSKVFADISWCDIPSILNSINKLSPCYDRLMFGSDAPLGIYSDSEKYLQFVTNIKNVIELEFSDKEDILEKIFFKNAQKLFKI